MVRKITIIDNNDNNNEDNNNEIVVYLWHVQYMMYHVPIYLWHVPGDTTNLAEGNSHRKFNNAAVFRRLFDNV